MGETNENNGGGAITVLVKVGIVGVLAIAIVGIIIFKSKSATNDSTSYVNKLETEHLSELKDASILENSRRLPKMVDLGSKSCIPCKMMAPILDELASEYKGKLEVVFIDVNEDKSAGRKFKINLIPTQIFLSPSGEELLRHEGFIGKEDILNQWKALGISLDDSDTSEPASISAPPETNVRTVESVFSTDRYNSSQDTPSAMSANSRRSSCCAK